MQLPGYYLKLNRNDFKVLALLKYHGDIISILTDIRGFLPVGSFKETAFYKNSGLFSMVLFQSN